MVEGKNTARGQMIGRTSQNKTLNFVVNGRPEPQTGDYVPVRSPRPSPTACGRTGRIRSVNDGLGIE